MNGGVHYKIKPLMKKEEKVCSSARVCLVHGRKFMDGMKHQHLCYALIPRVDKEGSREVLVEVLGMLYKVWIIISDNVSEGVPSIREISNKIGLVPRSSFPNKAIHKMTPTKNKELNKQV